MKWQEFGFADRDIIYFMFGGQEGLVPRWAWNLASIYCQVIGGCWVGIWKSQIWKSMFLISLKAWLKIKEMWTLKHVLFACRTMLYVCHQNWHRVLVTWARSVCALELQVLSTSLIPALCRVSCDFFLQYGKVLKICWQNHLHKILYFCTLYKYISYISYISIYLI